MPKDMPPTGLAAKPRFVELPSGSFLWRVSRQPGTAADGEGAPFQTPPDRADDAGRTGRFGPTTECQYRYCYAALDDLTALCEVLLRNVGFNAPSRYLPQAEVAGRRLSLLEAQKTLWLVSLADAADLAAARQDSWLIHAESPDYWITQRWAHWLRDSTAPDGQPPAGLMWRSKRQPGGLAVVLFGDRCEGKVACSSFGERQLDDKAGLEWLNLRLELLHTRVAGEPCARTA